MRVELLQAFRSAAPAYARWARDRHRLAAVALEHAFGLEQAVDLRDRHRIDRVPEGQFPDRRQRRSGRELAARDHAADLLEQLPIDRHARVRLQNEHVRCRQVH